MSTKQLKEEKKKEKNRLCLKMNFHSVNDTKKVILYFVESCCIVLCCIEREKADFEKDSYTHSIGQERPI